MKDLLCKYTRHTEQKTVAVDTGRETFTRIPGMEFEISVLFESVVYSDD